MCSSTYSRNNRVNQGHIWVALKKSDVFDLMLKVLRDGRNSFMQYVKSLK